MICRRREGETPCRGTDRGRFRWDRRSLIRVCALFLLADVLLAAVCIVLIRQERRPTPRDALAREIGITADMTEAQQAERLAVALGEASRHVTMYSEPLVGPEGVELMLSNAGESSCAVAVEISLFPTGERLAACDLVEPGWRLEQLALERELPPGEYPCLARCYFYTMDEELFLGHTTRQLLLRVME